MQRITGLRLVKTEDKGVQVEITYLSPPENTQAGILLGVYHSLVTTDTLDLEKFAKFRAEVEDTDLDNKGMVPTLQFCGCGHHIFINTYAGELSSNTSFEELRILLTHLVKHSIITTDEAKTLEAQAREKMPDMPEGKKDVEEGDSSYKLFFVSLGTDPVTSTTPQD